MSREILDKLREKKKYETKDFTIGKKIKLECEYPTTNYTKKEHTFEYNLHCPVCGSPHLHQHTVGIYNRCEDETTGTHVEVSGNSVVVDRNLAGNPSGRRQGLSIAFECEECGADSILNVYQHKGHSLMNWE